MQSFRWKNKFYFIFLKHSRKLLGGNSASLGTHDISNIGSFLRTPHFLSTIARQRHPWSSDEKNSQHLQYNILRHFCCIRAYLFSLDKGSCYIVSATIVESIEHFTVFNCKVLIHYKILYLQSHHWSGRCRNPKK